jgi:hypothetical protein
LRTYVMGERAFDQPSTDADVAAMQVELASTRCTRVRSASRRHAAINTRRPTTAPSRLASRSWDEVCRLVSVMTDLGTGIFQLTSEPAGQSPDPEVRREYFDRLRTLATVERRADLLRGVADDRRSSRNRDDRRRLRPRRAHVRVVALARHLGHHIVQDAA